jgi:polyhydroxyalkanoate synthesis regulator phasin
MSQHIIQRGKPWKMPKRAVKQINFTENDQDVLDHLMKQDNASRYVIRLIRQDMEQRELSRENIKQLIREILEENNQNEDNKKLDLDTLNDLIYFK